MLDEPHLGEFPISKCPMVQEPFKIPQRIGDIEKRLEAGAEHHRKLDNDVEYMLSVLTNGLVTKVSLMEVSMTTIKTDIGFLRSSAYTKPLVDKVVREVLKIVVAALLAAAGLAATVASVLDKTNVI